MTNPADMGRTALANMTGAKSFVDGLIGNSACPVLTMITAIDGAKSRADAASAAIASISGAMTSAEMESLYALYRRPAVTQLTTKIAAVDTAMTAMLTAYGAGPAQTMPASHAWGGTAHTPASVDLTTHTAFQTALTTLSAAMAEVV